MHSLSWRPTRSRWCARSSVSSASRSRESQCLDTILDQGRKSRRLVAHAAESGDEDSVGGTIASNNEREVRGAVTDSGLRVRDRGARGLERHTVCDLELTLHNSIRTDAYRDQPARGIDVER